MKPSFNNQRNDAWSRFELLFVVLLMLFIFCLLLAMLMPARLAQHRQAQWAQCVINLRQTALALRIWEGDNNNEYPMQVSTNNGGGKEWIQAGDVADCLRVATNELSTPIVLICPADKSHTVAKNFDDFDNSHISYFLSPDASETYPQMVLSGDDNLAVNGLAMKPGVFDLSTNAPVSWTRARHKYVGNLGFADGSVAAESSSGLLIAFQYAVQGTPTTTNRLAIP